MFVRTVWFGEYDCDGPGADDSNRVGYAKRLKASEAAPYLSTSYIDGQDWILDIPDLDQTHFIQFHSSN